jgi:hypothetical protein
LIENVITLLANDTGTIRVVCAEVLSHGARPTSPTSHDGC